MFISLIYRKITICFAFWFDRHQGGNIFNQGMIILSICFPRMAVFFSYASGSVRVTLASVYVDVCMTQTEREDSKTDTEKRGVDR